MTAKQLIGQFQKRGISFRIENDKLLASPSAKLTAKDKQVITRAKQTIVDYLSHPEQPQPTKKHRPGAVQKRTAGVIKLGENTYQLHPDYDFQGPEVHDFTETFDDLVARAIEFCGLPGKIKQARRIHETNQDEKAALLLCDAIERAYAIKTA